MTTLLPLTLYAIATAAYGLALLGLLALIVGVNAL